jgi:hypothetical protein
MYQLPTFQGYTVDMRLRQFRKVEGHESIEFIEFDSPEGHQIMKELVDFAYQVIEASPVATKVRLGNQFLSLDNYLDQIGPEMENVADKLADLRIGIMAALKVSYDIQQRLGFKGNREE